MIFRCYPIQKINICYQQIFSNFNKTSSKIDQAHCSNHIRIKIDPNSQSFQHLLHNKPAKVDHNLISFQTDFTLDEKFFLNNNISTTF